MRQYEKTFPLSMPFTLKGKLIDVTFEIVKEGEAAKVAMRNTPTVTLLNPSKAP